MSKIFYIIFFTISLAMSQFTVESATMNGPARLLFSVRNTTDSSISVNGYDISIYVNTPKEPIGVSYAQSVNNEMVIPCGNNMYVYSTKIINTTKIKPLMCIEGNNSCSDRFNIAFYDGGTELPLNITSPYEQYIVIRDTSGDIVAGDVPIGYESCDVSSSSTETSSSSEVTCTVTRDSVNIIDSLSIKDSITFIDSIIFIDSLNIIDSTYIVIRDSVFIKDSINIVDVLVIIDSVNIIDSIIIRDSTEIFTKFNYIDSLIIKDSTNIITSYNLQDSIIFKDSVRYIDSVIIRDSLNIIDSIVIRRDTTYIGTEVIADVQINIVNELDFSVTLIEGLIKTTPYFDISISVTGLDDNDIVELFYIVHSYGEDGQYVDRLTGNDNFDVSSRSVIETRRYEFLRQDSNGYLIDENYRKYGTGVYYAVVQAILYINGKSTKISEFGSFGYKR